MTIIAVKPIRENVKREPQAMMFRFFTRTSLSNSP